MVFQFQQIMAIGKSLLKYLILIYKLALQFMLELKAQMENGVHHGVPPERMYSLIMELRFNMVNTTLTSIQIKETELQ